jgi:hypothetical protein
MPSITFLEDRTQIPLSLSQRKKRFPYAQSKRNGISFRPILDVLLNPILLTVWLDNHALTFKK